MEDVAGDAAIVIDDGAPAASPENAHEFCPGAGKLEPMQRLADGHKVGAMFGQGCGLGRAVDTCQFGILRAQLLARGPHFAVGLDRQDRIAIRKKQLSQQSRTRANVGNDRGGSETAMLLKQMKHRDRILRTKFAICIDAIGKSFFRVCAVAA
ncbi:MAG: hypothetical protein WCE63_04195 [Acidobacteriaceae bacterium]